MYLGLGFLLETPLATSLERLSLGGRGEGGREGGREKVAEEGKGGRRRRREERTEGREVMSMDSIFTRPYLICIRHFMGQLGFILHV
jgi:hypothetical protein